MERGLRCPSRLSGARESDDQSEARFGHQGRFVNLGSILVWRVGEFLQLNHELLQQGRQVLSRECPVAVAGRRMENLCGQLPNERLS